MSSPSIWTIGHSTHSFERFLRLVVEAGITAIADVRSAPYSRNFQQFNKAVLRGRLREEGITYSFLGNELGGRPRDHRLYDNGIADYELMSLTPEFGVGIDRLMKGAKRYRIALMCSEHDPMDCHRCLLVSRALKERGFAVWHILANGCQKSQAAIEEELLADLGLVQGQSDFFTPHSDSLALAYRDRARRIAFSLMGTNRNNSAASK